MTAAPITKKTTTIHTVESLNERAPLYQKDEILAERVAVVALAVLSSSIILSVVAPPASLFLVAGIAMGTLAYLAYDPSEPATFEEREKEVVLIERPTTRYVPPPLVRREYIEPYYTRTEYVERPVVHVVRETPPMSSRPVVQTPSMHSENRVPTRDPSIGQVRQEGPSHHFAPPSVVLQPVVPNPMMMMDGRVPSR